MEAQLEEAKQRSIEQQGRRTIPVARRIITAPVSSESEAQAQREQQSIIQQTKENLGRRQRGRPYISSSSESEGTKERRVLSRSSVGNAIYSALSNQGYVPNYTQVEQPVSSSESGSESSGSDKPPGS